MPIAQLSGIKVLLTTYSFIEDDRRPVVGTLLQHKHDVSGHHRQLATRLGDKLKSDNVGLSFEGSVEAGDAGCG